MSRKMVVFGTVSAVVALAWIFSTVLGRSSPATFEPPATHSDENAETAPPPSPAAPSPSRPFSAATAPSSPESLSSSDIASLHERVENLLGKLRDASPGNGPAPVPAYAAREEKLSSREPRKIHPALEKDHAESGALRTQGISYPRYDDRGRVLVKIAYDPGPRREAAIDLLLSAEGASAFGRLPEDGILEAYLYKERLEEWAAQPWVRSIVPVGPMRVRTGSVVTEADQVLQVASLRQQLGVSGRGVKVGVISDGVDSLRVAQASGDLPADVVVAANQSVGAQGLDEGTAMLEIIHDLAPEAELFFHDGLSITRFIMGIRALRDLNCRIIVDDIGFANEPFFEDGPLAREVQQAADAGVVFVSAVGNDAQRHAKLNWTSRSSHGDDTNINEAVFEIPALVFPSGDEFMEMQIGPGQELTVVLQWTEPFGSSSRDYDLRLYEGAEYLAFLEEYLAYLQWLDSGGNPVAAPPLPSSPVPVAQSIGEQSGTQDPLEIAGVANTGSSWRSVVLVVEGYANAAESDTLEMLFWSTTSSGARGIPGPAGNPEGSVFGHPAAEGCLAIGAIDVNDPGLDTLRSYSSRGPRELRFPSTTVRLKPDFVSVDGVSVTGAGSFPTEFAGTSAAAPHVAAFAALLLEVAPDLSPSAVHGVFRETATDLGSVGRDDLFGYGLINPDEAIRSLGIDPEPPSTHVTVDSEEPLVQVSFGQDQMIDLKLKVEPENKIWILLQAGDLYPDVVFCRPSDRVVAETGRYVAIFESGGSPVAGADNLYFSRSSTGESVLFENIDLSDIGPVVIRSMKGPDARSLQTVQRVDLLPAD